MQFNEHLDQVLRRLGSNGAFLTVKSGERVNTMTIDWGLIGIQWQLPVFTVLVRPSRFTFELIETATDFTVSVPKDDRFNIALMLCGTKSGRNIDKYKTAGLALKPAQKVTTPVIDGDFFTYECRILYKTPLNSNEINSVVTKDCYPDGDFHTIYFGKIVDCYE
ncbi:MAG: flavin reductase family protein [Planctomycetaceae bacterium]|jgi:flavin reductase (DIM6/NTAB) family NADH-FMN oxidoreductase RutF|nr:flavin reductase family protein [Planctomycetaceae bacterium]